MHYMEKYRSGLSSSGLRQVEEISDSDVGSAAQVVRALVPGLGSAIKPHGGAKKYDTWS